MKKFVSLVLVLALALSLCTVAFAKTVSTEAKGSTTESVSGYYVVNLTNNDPITSNSDVDTHATTGYTKHTVDGVSHSYFVPESYVAGGTSYFVCDEDNAGYRIFDKNDKFVCFVTTVACVDIPEGKLIAEGDEDECDAYNADVVEYYTWDGTTETFTKAVKEKSETATGSPVYVNGVVVLVDSTANGVKYAHKFKAADATYKATTNKDNQKLVAVKCSNCGKTFEVVTSLGKYDGDFLTLTIDTAGAAAEDYGVNTFHAKDGTYYVLLGNAAAAGTTSTTVDSSKTFDAGVAMYVGLSLMSVAGSAVVIGKKKEF